MTIHLYQPAQPLATDGGGLLRVLQAADVGKRDLIRVVGPSGALAAMWLGQHGYDRVVFAQSAASPSASPADAVLVAHPCVAADLTALVGDADAIRAGGALIVQTRPGPRGEEVEAVAAWLRRAGFASQRQLNDKGRPVCIARRIGWPTARKAA
jgi:hypothetical protein